MVLLSHSETDISIYIKDVYVEDQTLYAINISSVRISTHPDYIEMKRRAILTPTVIPQNLIFEKTLFSLTNSTDLGINDALNNGNFSDTEIDFLNGGKNSILLARTSLYIEGIDIYREEHTPDTSQILILAVYLQQKIVKLVDLNVNITGDFIYLSDPASTYFENINYDILKAGSFYDTNFMKCNYPEAYLTPTNYLNNISVALSDISMNRTPKSFIYGTDIGNTTYTNID